MSLQTRLMAMEELPPWLLRADAEMQRVADSYLTPAYLKSAEGPRERKQVRSGCVGREMKFWRTRVQLNRQLHRMH